MNEKIPVNRLAQEIAAAVGFSPSEVQQFIKDLFAYVEAEVSAGNDVSVPGLGRFSKSAVNGEPIAYEPDAEYAATLNADFEMFSPVELNDGVTEEAMEMAVTEEAVKEAEPDTELHQQPVAENEAEPETGLQHNTGQETVFTAPAATSEDDDAKVGPDAEDSEDIVNEHEDADDSAESEDEANHAAATDKSEKVSDVKDELAVDIVTDAHVETIAEEEEEEVITEQPETPAAEPLMAAIPEQEEEYVIVHGRKSRFWVGFIIGLVLGFAIGVIAFVAYLVNISVITPEKLFN